MKKEISEIIKGILKEQCKKDDAYIKIDEPTDQILELFAQEKQKWVEEILKTLEKVIEEEYGEGEVVVNRIINAFRNQTL